MEDLSKKPVKICNGKFLLKLTKDKLKAILQSNEGASFDSVPFEEIVREVQNYGVTYGIVAKLPVARDGLTIIANGLPPVLGENAKVKPLVKPSIISSPKSKGTGADRVDYRELGTIVNVPKGQQLLKKIPATAGTPGKNVLGEDISTKPGKDVTIKCGPGAVLSADGLQVSAEVDGKFVMGDGKPSVYEEHVVTGDVDMAVGNIAFCGTRLEITGELPTGFKIKCKGDVVIGKGVNNAQILAGGNVMITGGLVGPESDLRAKGDVVLDFCENVGLIETRGSLKVTNFVIQGNVKAAKSMTVVEGKGSVIGGNYILGGSMHVKHLGSDAEVLTEVVVGLQPELEKRKRQIEAAKAYWPDKLSDILKNISTLNEMKKTEGKNFGKEKAKALAELNKMMPEVMEKNNQLTEMQMQLDKELEEASGESIYVYETLYPGVVVTIGKVTRVMDRQEEHVVIELQKSTKQIHARGMTPEEREGLA
jgi:hypothetical protein